MDIFELCMLVPNSVTELLKMKNTIVKLLEDHFSKTKTASKKMGFEQVYESIKSDSFQRSICSTLKTTPLKKENNFSTKSKKWDICTPETSSTGHKSWLQTSIVKKTKYVNKQYCADSAVKKTVGCRQTLLSRFDVKRGLKLMQNSDAEKQNNSVKVVQIQQIIKDNLFDVGTKRTSQIFNGRVVNFWD